MGYTRPPLLFLPLRVLAVLHKGLSVGLSNPRTFPWVLMPGLEGLFPGKGLALGAERRAVSWFGCGK